MNPDRLIHEKKTFAELENEDIEVFLRERKFNTEHLSIEFKSGFPQLKTNRFNHQKICKYITGFLNSEGGLIIYGVEDRIRDETVSYPDYICGLKSYPSLEDLSEWAKNYIYPSTHSPNIRFFKITGRDVVIIKVPSGINRPYCLINPKTKEIVLYTKTAGGISALAPGQVREFFRSSIIEQAEKITSTLKKSESITVEAGTKSGTKETERIEAHQKDVRAKLEDIENYGYFVIYCYPKERQFNKEVQHLGLQRSYPKCLWRDDISS